MSKRISTDETVLGDIVCVSTRDDYEICYLNKEGKQMFNRLSSDGKINPSYREIFKSSTKSADSNLDVQRMDITLKGEKYHLTIARDVSYKVYDALTKTKNRQSYIEKVAYLRKNNSRNIGIMVIDIDNLRNVNQSYGHRWGDAMLKYTASVLKDHFGDEVYRAGEDEFVVLTEKTTEKNSGK
ncbi:GGDEF domain-containing protein [Aequitasia blattaphilus]|uniref:GGDEF domain-containing protein n=1 Tax=Aequitasia blattaphilus TaxID=2949332 RepID=A0ABT1E9I2_9FIRM|nr:GGDEF domain-containing protein [Aequitasia blattaphilus]MCP1102499.1 GGDEF domain-containing protein [Aequitasia blattaphilus]MCR8615139.1 GGDEF domain-containing protein [Aequitasia blattaphilus]